VSGPRLAVYSFGGARVLDPRGDELDWPREKGRELFFYLLHNGASRSDRLHAGLWPNASPGQAKAGLYAATYALRRALGADVLRVTGQTYQLNGDAIAFHDAGEFDVLDARLHREFDPERRVAALERIVRLYGGPLLDGLHAEWLEEHRRAYEVRYADALRSLVAARAERGAWRTCLAAALDGLKADPYCESFYAYATRSYIALGDRDAARRTFREGRRRLAEIFGV